MSGARIARPIGASTVPLIVALSDRVVRNLWITTAYHDLAASLTQRLGTTNLSWCAFAAWASKTAGISIRADHLRGFVRSAVSRSEVFRHVLEVLAERVPDRVEAAIEDALLAVVDDSVEAVSEQVARGNLMVFEELAPIFARLVATLPDPSTHAAFLASVVAIDGKPEATAQLRQAFGQYLQSTKTADPRRRAEHVLLANALIGVTEQMRLQPVIQSALDTPFGERVLAAADARLARRNVPEFLRRLVRARLAQRVAELQAVWRRAVTEFFLRMQAPGGDLSLGRDAPPHGSTQFPGDLQSIADPPLRHFLDQYDRTGGTARGSGASDWADLHDRLNYILNLFRSWQQRAQLLQPPFTPQQLRALEDARLPPEPL